MPENPVKWLKNRLKMYLISVHDYNEGFYIDQFLKSVVIETIRDIIEPVVMFGFIGYATMYGITMIIPALAGFVKLGTSPLTVIMVFLFTGIILTVIRNVYRTVRFGCLKHE